MTEKQWLKGNDWRNMLDNLETRFKIEDRRRQRLLAVAACRLSLLKSSAPEFVTAVNTAELFADGEIDSETLMIADNAAWTRSRITEAANCFVWVADADFYRGMLECCFDYSSRIGADSVANLVREVFGNPFKGYGVFKTNRDAEMFMISPGELYPDGWFTQEWLGESVLQMAEVIYREKTFDELPVLADAIDDVRKPWDMQPILDHLRSPGPHVRGCWALDLILGKERS